MNIKENKNNFEIEMAVPGFSKENIEVSLDEDVLHISAKKSKDNAKDNKDYARKEFCYNEFERRLQLPSSVNRTKNVKATYKDGILILQLDKNEEAQARPKKMIQIS
jgi:HSP20 family protein